MSAENYDMIFKIVITGDSYVGKTNILSKYLQNTFSQETKATVGVELGSKNITIDNNLIKAQIWDTAGQERYKSITNAYYKGAKGAFVVYDITRKESFVNVDRWIADIQANSNYTLSIVLIGNKCDLEDKRTVSKEDGEQKAKNFNIAFFETSALQGTNIEKIFDMMINDVYSKSHKEFEEEIAIELGGGKSISLCQPGSEQIKVEKKKCCGK